MENNKKIIRKRKRKVRYDRLFGAAGIAALLIAGGTIAISKSFDKNTSDIVLEIARNSDGTSYKAQDLIDLYEKQNDGSMNKIGLIIANDEFNIYTDECITDKNDNKYYYCNVLSTNKVGLINADKLINATRIENKEDKFDSIYHIKDEFKDKYIEMYSSFSKNEIGNVLYKGKNIFVDKNTKVIDNNGITWYRAKNDSGDIGYIKYDDTVEEVKKGTLNEVKASEKEILQLNNKFSNVQDYIYDIENGDRVVLIGDGEEKGLYYAVYFDSDGKQKFGQIGKDILKDVDFEKSEMMQVPEKKEQENNFSIEDVYNWHRNPYSGVKGIDISGMTGDYLEQVLKTEEPDVQYGIIRIGASGYGCDTKPYGNYLLPYESTANVTFDENTFKLKKEQIDILKKHNKTVMVYFYATDVTKEEADEVVNQIEKSIDMLGGNIEPIIDCEMYSEGYDERMGWINSPFLEEYNKKNNTNLDFSLYKNQFSNIELLNNSEKGDALLNFELKMNKIIDDNKEIQEFIAYCQDKKAQNIAHMYHKLYNDGYLSGKNAIIYSGTKAVSKDSLKATITGDYESEFQKVSYFRMDDVNRYLNDPNGEYYIPGFNLMLWLADYTGNENFKRFEEYAISNQINGDIILDYNHEDESKYDKNIMCTEFFYQMKHQIDEKNNIKNNNINNDEIDIEK